MLKLSFSNRMNGCGRDYYLKIGTSGKLWAQWWSFQFHKIQRVFRLNKWRVWCFPTRVVIFVDGFKTSPVIAVIDAHIYRFHIALKWSKSAPEIIYFYRFYGFRATSWYVRLATNCWNDHGWYGPGMWHPWGVAKCARGFGLETWRKETAWKT